MWIYWYLCRIWFLVKLSCWKVEKPQRWHWGQVHLMACQNASCFLFTVWSTKDIIKDIWSSPSSSLWRAESFPSRQPQLHFHTIQAAWASSDCWCWTHRASSVKDREGFQERKQSLLIHYGVYHMMWRDPLESQWTLHYESEFFFAIWNSNFHHPLSPEYKQTRNLHMID